MKINIYTSTLFSLLVLFLSTCNNDSMPEPKQPTTKYEHPNTIYIDELALDGTKLIPISIENVVTGEYEITNRPKWIIPESYTGNIIDGILTFNYKLNKAAINYDNSFAQVAFRIKGVGTLIVNVDIYNSENLLDPRFPILNISTSLLDFDIKGNNLNIKLSNDGEKPLIWELYHQPAWLSVTPENGIINAHNYYYQNNDVINLVCNREDLEIGEYLDSIVIKNNSRNNPFATIHIKMKNRGKQNPPHIMSIAGIVRDSRFCKATNRLYIITQAPHALLIYDTNTAQWNNIALSNIPNCLTLSEDGKKAFIGGMAYMSVIDAENKLIAKNIDIAFNSYSIAYGENDWCYLTCDTYGHYGYFAINIKSNEVKESYARNIQQSTNLIKVKNKSFLLATRSAVSPNGVALADISGGSEIQEVSYWHESYGSKLWLTENSDYAIGNGGVAFKTPDESTGETLFSLATRLNDYYSISCVDHNQNTNKLWFTSSQTWSSNTPQIKCLDGKSYEHITAFNPEEYYTEVNGVSDFYTTIPHYTFSNKSGSSLYILREVWVGGSDVVYNKWSLEIKTLN